ncbi:hypothetical protein [Tautonia marina]|uniref:hypothetical protein n=1 Tax=Tautonia marina TaxID=2653855 RepID=UPI001260E39E|nr:hypothetical protein [Tautonia marina]
MTTFAPAATILGTKGLAAVLPLIRDDMFGFEPIDQDSGPESVVRLAAGKDQPLGIAFGLRRDLGTPSLIARDQ